jgi:hypothetical protein
MNEPGCEDPEQEHLFAPFVRNPGRGKTGSLCTSRADADALARSLWRDRDTTRLA